jgi:hypothetical protein
MPLWRRSEARDAAWALAFALWCVTWPAGIVLAGGTTPGFFSLRGGDGLREMVTVFLPLSYGTALFAWGVAAFAAMWALLRLRRWLDPEGQALDSIRWALSSRSLNLTLAMLMLSTVLLIMLGEAGVLVPWLMSIDIALGRFLVAWWWMILLVAFAILSPLIPLCLLNPDTLARDRLERWWRPFWPGFVAVLIAVTCWMLVPALMEHVWKYLPASVSVAVGIPAQVLDYLVVLACDLIAFSWWFSRKRATSAKVLGAQLFHWRTLRLYLGFDLLCVAWMLVVAVPVLLLAAFATHLGPQYESWQSDGILEMPVAYALLMDVVREFREREWLYLGVLVAELLLGVALARLLHHAVAGEAGGVPQAGVDGAGR